MKKNQVLLAYFGMYKTSGRLYFQINYDLENEKIVVKARRNSDHRYCEFSSTDIAMSFINFFAKNGWKLLSYNVFSANEEYFNLKFVLFEFNLKTLFKVLELI